MCCCICVHIICSCLLSATLQSGAQLTGQEVAGESRSCMELNSSVLVLHNNICFIRLFAARHWCGPGTGMFFNCQNRIWFCSPPMGWRAHSNYSERNKMRNRNGLLFEGLNHYVGRGSPNPKYCESPQPKVLWIHTHCALKLILSNEGYKVLIITVLFEGLSSKLTHEDYQGLFSPIRSPPLWWWKDVWKDVLNLETDDSWQLSGWPCCHSELCICFYIFLDPSHLFETCIFPLS